MPQDDRPILDVENVAEALEELARRADRVHDELISLGLDHVNKIEGSLFRSDEVFKLRETILYRRDSTCFHLVLLLRVHNHAVAELHSRIEGSELPLAPLIMNRSATEQFAIFDSIVFHAISLFDYIGNLVDYLCGAKKQKRLKWNGAVRSARDASNQISRSPVADVLDRLDREWVDSLYDHRSKVIHYQYGLGGRTLSQDLLQGTYDLKVYAPRRLVSGFDDLGRFRDTHAITLRYAGFWLAQKTMDSVVQVIQSLRRHMEDNRKVPEGQEPMQFRPPNMLEGDAV